MNSQKNPLTGEETVLMSPPQPLEGVETTVITADEMGRILSVAQEKRAEVQETLRLPKEILVAQVKITTASNLLEGIMSFPITEEKDLPTLCQAISHLEMEKEQKTKLLRFALSRSDVQAIPLRIAKDLLMIPDIDQAFFMSKLSKDQIPKKDYMFELLAVLHDPKAVNLLFSCFGYKMIVKNITQNARQTSGALSAEQVLKLLQDDRFEKRQLPGLIHQIKPSEGEKKMRELMRLITSLGHAEAIKTLFERYELEMEYFPQQ